MYYLVVLTLYLTHSTSFYTIVAGSLHRLLCEVHGEALCRKSVPLGGSGLEEMGMLSIIISAYLSLCDMVNVAWIPMLINIFIFILKKC